jgi:hypothetical protein
MPPTFVVIDILLLGLIVLILTPCHYYPYAHHIFLHSRHCICDFLFLPMPPVAAPSLICWCVHLMYAGNYTSSCPALLTPVIYS